MFGNQKASRHFEELKAIMPQIEGVMFLSDDEYHSYYFTTNNTLYPYFFGNSIEDREKFQKLYENIEQKCA
jgi:hypothetical protein